MSQLQIKLAMKDMMTAAQERKYADLRDIGWEFCCWDEDDIIMQLWHHNTMDSRSLVSEVQITPNGTVMRTEQP